MKYLVLTLGSLITSLACQNDPQPSPNTAAEHTAAGDVSKAPAKRDKDGQVALTQVAPVERKQALKAGAADKDIAGEPTGKGSAPKAPGSKGSSKAVAAGANGTAARGATPAAAAAAGQLKGPIVEEDAFSIWLQSEGPTVSGKPAKVTAVLVAHPPYHCNEEYPHKFKFAAAPEGLSYPKKIAKGMKTTAKKGVLAIPVQAESAGTATISGKLLFSVCTEERCLVEKQELTLALVVQ